jgi:glycosyltransferase involved in cell wall biosynthesis
MKISVCIPTFKGGHLIGEALKSIFSQNYEDFEVIIGDDNNDLSIRNQTIEVVKSFNQNKINYICNESNLGYPLNLKNIVSKAKGEIIYLFAQDDILAQDAFQRTVDAFNLSADIGVVTRPYYWFTDNINEPVRSITPYSFSKDSVLSLNDGYDVFYKIFESVGQLSGLAYRIKYIDNPFHKDVFPAHIYPFAGILKNYKCVYLKDYMVAVGINDSQTRSVSSIYDISPTETWLKMYDSVFDKDEFSDYRKWGYEHILTNYLGLLQIRNYSSFRRFIYESYIMVKNRPKSLLNIKFISIFIICLFIPRVFLIEIVAFIKRKMFSNKKKKINFNFVNKN